MGIGLKEKIGTSLAKMFGVSTIVKKSIPQISQSYAWVGGYPVYNLSDVINNINIGYCGSEDVYSIVRRIARASAMIMDTFTVNKIVDDEAMKQYQFLQQQKNFSTASLLKQKYYKDKAFEEIKPGTAPGNFLQNLINNPNPSYAKSEFYEGAATFRLITGNTYIHTPLLEFGVNAGRPNEMWLMPSQWTALQVSETWPRRILGYRLIMGVIMEVPVEEVIQIRYFNPQYTFVGNELIGLSPLRVGSKILDKNAAETDYSVNAFQNSGISGIIYNKDVRSDEIESGALSKLKTDFYNEGTGTQNARKLLFQAGDIGYTSVGLGPVDMDVLASMKLTFKKLCNLLNVSDRLFNNDATGSEVSDDNCRKDFYTNAVMPEVYAVRDALNAFLVPKFNTATDKYFIDCDISNIVELQDDFKDMATVYSTLPIMNPAVIAQAFNMDYDSDDPNMDKWFIKAGYSTVEDVIAGMSVDPLPIDTPNGN